MTKAIIFDFDGVILESAIIKTKAFETIVEGYPEEQADAFVKYHMTHMGISRHVKFRYFIEEILKEEYTDEKEKELADTFERIVYEKVMKCAFVPGAKDFLEHNYQKYDFYIASGTPDEEMHRIAAGRNLSKYFKEIYGTPLKKKEIINIIIKKYGYSREEVIFVGDAETDLNAATDTGIGFIGRNTPENKTTFANVKYKVDDLREIKDIIERALEL